MALINCPECNNEISDKAVSCPKCAFPINQQTSKPISKNDKGLTVADGVKTGCGMFIVLPLIIISLLIIVFALIFLSYT